MRFFANFSIFSLFHIFLFILIIFSFIFQVIKPNTALKLQAIRDTKDNKNIDRKVGEEWLIRDSGSYLPDVNEKVILLKSLILQNMNFFRLSKLSKAKSLQIKYLYI